MSEHLHGFSKSPASKSVSRRRALPWLCAAIASALIAPFGAWLAAHAQAPPDTPIPRVANPPLPSDLTNLPSDLRAVEVPGPPNLDGFIKDPAMAVALGK